jgi:hypothetical protein
MIERVEDGNTCQKREDDGSMVRRFRCCLKRPAISSFLITIECV